MNRNQNIDIMKGLGIFLVVFAHVLKNNGIITNAIYIFHMPLFFIVSGYLIKYEGQCSFLDYLKKKSKGIMCPYFIFSILSFLYWFIIERKFRGEGITIDTNIIRNIFLNIFVMKVDSNLLLSNVVLWFLPCLFFSNILFYFIRRIDKRYIRITIVFFIFIIGYILNLKSIILPFAVETVCISVMFIDIGFEIKNINLNNINKFIGIFSIMFYIIAVVFNGKVGMLAHMYGNPILFILGAVSGTGIIYIISIYISRLKRISNIAIYMGLNSLTIMLVHEPLKRIIIVVASGILHIPVSNIRESVIISCLIGIIVIVIIFPFSIFINKYTPWLVGRKNKK